MRSMRFCVVARANARTNRQSPPAHRRSLSLSRSLARARDRSRARSTPPSSSPRPNRTTAHLRIHPAHALGERIGRVRHDARVGSLARLLPSRVLRRRLPRERGGGRDRARETTHTHGEKHASIRLNTTEGDARHSWRVDYTGSASRCARARARWMRAARRRPPVLFARRSRALSSRDETRTERNGVDRVLDDADEIQKTNHHRRLTTTTTTTTTRAGAAETIIGRGWRRETRYARSTRRRAMRCATRRERRCARSGG